MQGTILLLEDDTNLGFMLKEHLEFQGFGVTLVPDGVKGLSAVQAGNFDLLLVDVMMPKKDGLTFAREVRERDMQTPIIFLTAKSLKEDRIEGFRAGADDYVTKPFSTEELTLRIQAVLRRTGAAGQPENVPGVFALGSYTFDVSRRDLQRNGVSQKLTTKEAELLRMLCLHMNRTLHRDAALSSVWGNSTYFSSRSMDVFISRLRKYLQQDPSVEIVNVHGRGYKLLVGQP
jgi:DNA-binding response OmpR family regulator